MPQPPTRASRARRAALLACAAVAAVGISVPAAAAKTPKPVVKIAPGAVTVYKVGEAPDTLPDDVRNAVIATLTGYVNAATVTPLQKGAVDDAGLATALAPAVTARLAGPDRAVLVDEGLPKATSRVKVAATPVALTGLADGAGSVVVVTANVDATTTTKTAKGRLVIKRTGDLVLEPDNGTWKITGYTLNVVRAGRAAIPKPTPTVPAAPAAAAPTPATAAR
jgi:hypothetical protein